MKNVLVCSPRKFSEVELATCLKAQVENSLYLGWAPEDILILTDFAFEHQGVKSISLEIPRFMRTNIKTYGAYWLFTEYGLEDAIWLHDPDAWQLHPFELNLEKDVGAVTYRGEGRINGASLWYKPKSRDIIEEAYRLMEEGRVRREESTLDLVFQTYKERVDYLDCRYNFNKQHIKSSLYDHTARPIYVIHKPTRSAPYFVDARLEELRERFGGLGRF